MRNWVRKEIGPIATPDILHWTDALPKKHALGKLCVVSCVKLPLATQLTLEIPPTLADPGVVEKLLEEKQSLSLTI